MIYESFVPDKEYREIRNLARTRLGLVRTRTNYKNKIHSILAKYEHGSTWLRYTMVEAAHTTIHSDERIDRFYFRIAVRRGDLRRQR